MLYTLDPVRSTDPAAASRDPDSEELLFARAADPADAEVALYAAVDGGSVLEPRE
jgi:hypothetical protein